MLESERSEWTVGLVPFLPGLWDTAFPSTVKAGGRRQCESGVS